MSRALVLTHVRHEGMSGLRRPVEAAGYRVEEVAAVEAAGGLDWLAPDLLVVMGGPMGVYEQDAYPWLAAEIAGLATRIGAGRPTLGICLGAQLIAAALDARVYPGPVREVGFAPVRLLPVAQGTPLRALADVPLLHWHGDTFDLPSGVDRLAETDAYANQAFRRDDALLALQFHPEVGEDGFDSWLEGADDYLASAGASAPAMRDAHRRHGHAAVAAGRQMLARWLAALPA